MADNNRNWGGNRSSNQDWNDVNSRRGQESGYDDRGSYRGRYEGGQGYSDWNRSGQDYGQGSTYGEGRYDRDYDYNRNRGQSSYGGRYSEESNDFNDPSYYGGSENRSREYGSSYGRGSSEGRFGERGFGSRYGRERQSYSPGGYTSYGGGSGYGSNQWTGGYGGTNYGRNYGSTGSSYGSSYGSTGSGLQEGYGAGFGFGERSGLSDRDYGSSYRGDYGRRGYQGDINRGGNEERGWWDKTTDEVSSWFGDEEAERRREMDRRYKGKGPKNYQRSDERIKEDVNDRLSDDWFIDASDIEVSVQKGEVTLMGTVDERTSKRRAEDIAESVSGVKHVENRLRVSSMQTYGGTSTVGSATGTTGMGATTTTGSTSKSKQSGLMSESNK